MEYYKSNMHGNIWNEKKQDRWRFAKLHLFAKFPLSPHGNGPSGADRIWTKVSTFIYSHTRNSVFPWYLMIHFVSRLCSHRVHKGIIASLQQPFVSLLPINREKLLAFTTLAVPAKYYRSKLKMFDLCEFYSSRALRASTLSYSFSVIRSSDSLFICTRYYTKRPGKWREKDSGALQMTD